MEPQNSSVIVQLPVVLCDEFSKAYCMVPDVMYGSVVERHSSYLVNNESGPIEQRDGFWCFAIPFNYLNNVLVRDDIPIVNDGNRNPVLGVMRKQLYDILVSFVSSDVLYI